jgi:hypothetical protein
LEAFYRGLLRLSKRLAVYITGKVPFIVRPDVLQSDEAIVAVFAHEIHELQSIRELLRKHGEMSIESLGALTAFDNPGNLHDEAWDVADSLVERMRQGRES